MKNAFFMGKQCQIVRNTIAIIKKCTIARPIVSARYWNQVHGNNAEEAERDLEGLHTMRGLGKNMAFLIKCIRLGKEQLPPIERESKVYTNFIKKEG